MKEADRNILVRLPSKLDFLGSQLLVATGRAANSESLELSRAGITWDAKGIEVSAGLRKTNKRFYAIGDVNRLMQFSHAAAYEASLVLRIALFGFPVHRRRLHIA